MKQMRAKLFLCVLSVFILNMKSQTSIAIARAASINSTVTIKGVVINGPEMGTIRYVQDNTAGISAFSSTLSSLNRGDSVQITGLLTEYKNLLEISTSTANPAPISFTSLGAGVAQTPSVITTSQFNENVEGRLIKFMGCTFAASGTFSSGVNYTVNTGAGTFVARVTSSVSSLFGSTIPTGTLDIVGIGSQFCSSPTSGCTTGYQLALRDINDIAPASIGIKEFSKETLNLLVFPNPAETKIYFKINPDEIIRAITIMDVTGRVIYSSKDNLNLADVSTLINGMYTVQINTDKQNYRSKFLVEK